MKRDVLFVAVLKEKWRERSPYLYCLSGQLMNKYIPMASQYTCSSRLAPVSSPYCLASGYGRGVVG